MSEIAKARLGITLLLVGLLTAVAAASSPSLPQEDATCLHCHASSRLKSAPGRTVYVDRDVYSASVHGQAGVTCIDCHRDLKDIQALPHPKDLARVRCADCHAEYARTTTGGVHGTWSPRLAAAPVRCADCHGRHDIQPSSDPRSRVSPPNRPATCGRCHPGAGVHFAEGRVHELAGDTAFAPHGLVRILYKALIAVMGAAFLAYIAADLLRRRSPR